ncbi:MAG: VWA domain-containing protein [Planctomycetes bacterium]|nr:VWA domain-containing protein [Planctomycetota bacterium]
MTFYEMGVCGSIMLLAGVTETQQRVFEFAGIPGGWMNLVGFAAVVALCYMVIWLYRREGRAGAGARLRVGLATLRCAAIVMLAIIWLRPVLATLIVRTVTARVVVLADISASMSIVDRDSAAAGVSRRARVEKLLSDDEYDWLKRLAAENELSLYAFGEETSLVALQLDQPGSEAVVIAERSFEAATDMGQALASVIDDVGDSPIAAVILITDGAANTGMTEEEFLAYARRVKAPIHTVGVGQTTEPPNVRITLFTAPPAVARGDPFEIRLEIEAESVEPAELAIEITSHRLSDDGLADPAAERVVARRRLSVGDERRLPPLMFEVSAAEAGEFVYRVKLDHLPDEAVTDDNAAAVSVRVLDTQVRVLIIAGGPTFDYRFVTRLLERDRTVNLSCWLQSADKTAVRDGNTVITELPREPEDIFEYDVILLLDPNPRQFDSAWSVTLRRFVDEFGGGLMYQAGRYYSTRFLDSPAVEDIRAILPVVFDPDASVHLSEQGSYHTRAYPVKLPDDARGHPLLTLHDDPDISVRIWDALPGIWWHFPTLREKPIATVLLQHGDPSQRTQHGPAIIMATQPVGSGRTIMLSHDTTWRWRGPAEAYFNRFWVQTIRYLGQARRQGANKRGVITVDQDRVEVYEPFKIEARVLDESYAPWFEREITATIDLPDGQQLTPTLRAITGRDGWFSARVTIAEAGLAVIRVPLPGGADESLVKRVRVHRTDIEMNGLRQRAGFLRQIADQTGGQYLTLEQARDLPDSIKKATQVHPTRGPDHDLWDRWWVLLTLAAILAVEWTVRRRNHLL